MRVSSLALIGIVSGIVAAGIMLAVMMNTGRIGFVASHLPGSGNGSQQPAAPDDAISLERELLIHAQRLDELADTVQRLARDLHDSSAVSARLNPAVASPSTVSVGALTGAGFSQADAEMVMSLVETAELEQMEQRFMTHHGQPGRGPVGLVDSSSSPLSIRSAIVERFGERGFDRFLYATGQPNRIQVSSVLRNSPAEQAGFEPGDVIVEVSGEAVYSNRDLYRASVAGERGDLVAVTVARGTTQVELYVGRGPLGVRTDRLSVRPG